MAAATMAQAQLKSVSLRANRPAVQSKVVLPRTQRRSVITQAGFIGSPENIIMTTSTALVLVAGRFGLAPTVNRPTTAGLRLYEDKSAGIMSNDPAGFTAVDVLALGSLGHVLGAGIILGLRATGNI